MKKLLALVLALVMSMSLVTISNAAFKDADSIDYKEAVDVMNAVGVFVGDEKGNFNAKENLTREQAAKIIAYLELGSKAADALVGGATFTDVASSRWSAGFVGYCAQAGIVSGVGDSKFDPAGQLTALQFGKMLLVELGYLDQYGYAAFVDADDTLQYAVILAYEVGSRLDSPRAKLLFTDGTTKKVDVKALKKADGTAYSATSLGDYISASAATSASPSTSGNSNLNKYDVVSYTVNSDEEYTLTLAADARDATVGSAKITKGIPSLAGTVSGNGYNVGDGSGTAGNPAGVLYANGKTTFLVIDESGTDTTYTSYTGIANVPNIEWKGGSYTAPITLLTEDNTIAKIVVVAKTKAADASHPNNLYISDGSKAVTFIKGGSAGQSYTKDLGYYYEYDAIIDGAESKIKTDFAVTNYSILTGVSYNSKGVATGYSDIAYMDIDAPATKADGTNLFTAVGTEATTNSVVKIGTTLYAFDDDCKVYYIGTDGTLIASAPASIGKDANDQVWFKLTDGLLSTVFIKVVDETSSAVTPTGNNVTVSLASASNVVTLTVANAAGAPDTTAWSAQMKITNTQTGLVSYVNLAGGSAITAGSSDTSNTLSSVSINLYQAIVTINGVTLTSNTVAG